MKYLQILQFFQQRNAQVKDKLNKSITTFKTLEDIELYEKANGCKFSFVQAWDDSQVWSAREFLKHEKSNVGEKEWTRRMVYSLNIQQNKDKCKEGKVVILFHANKVFMAGNQLPAKRK